MQGTVLNFDRSTETGSIGGIDGMRYAFKASSVQRDLQAIGSGARVSFAAAGLEALAIIPTDREPASMSRKPRLAASFFAIALVGLGLHGFYFA
ncbi:hypothetical protein RGQ15_07090 [Paracoccus sp. MBLB3053]|uniref:Uncharacterized protein n=1 Tax=Paracoccus aurantius TaxID=3073814 RepID=A0ABU2HQN4_9RHOB|nr:hypothetical protein [Paracoccus sp. MBLB3053]MDS9467338.1 hypothetical protein [Paracoccus sp. MBLB3053]